MCGFMAHFVPADGQIQKYSSEASGTSSSILGRRQLLMGGTGALVIGFKQRVILCLVPTLAGSILEPEQGMKQ